ncbi:hypothetical protein KC19_3G128800 [Ceratodon purpureus]|uniref:Uncharacterized protein n=1 Tax=Ceratodon purpureus TaxID=3225 RepID=A0A8T0IJY7_CERPU|nr:hypothetical protein KC19_3G128800 [Ceratodon purpureus]
MINMHSAMPCLCFFVRFLSESSKLASRGDGRTTLKRHFETAYGSHFTDSEEFFSYIIGERATVVQ